jgi:hypothetical protein
MAVNWRNLPLDWRKGIKKDLVIGLDIANIDADEGEPTTRAVWRGTDENDTVPQFGTAILSE